MIQFDSFARHYNENSLFRKIRRYASIAGSKLIYPVLILYYVMIDSGTSIVNKMSIAAALGYFIFPLDALPDLTPVIGYGDDFAIIVFTLSRISSSVTDEITQKAKMRIAEWFPGINEEEFSRIEKEIAEEGNK